MGKFFFVPDQSFRLNNYLLEKYLPFSLNECIYYLEKLFLLLLRVWRIFSQQKFLHFLTLTLAGGGLELVGLVVMVTPIFPLSFDKTAAFLFVPRSILDDSGILSSLLELFEFSLSGALTAGTETVSEASSGPKTRKLANTRYLNYKTDEAMSNLGQLDY